MDPLALVVALGALVMSGFADSGRELGTSTRSPSASC